jgi:hypothetical protein
MQLEQFWQLVDPAQQPRTCSSHRAQFARSTWRRGVWPKRQLGFLALGSRRTAPLTRAPTRSCHTHTRQEAEAVGSRECVGGVRGGQQAAASWRRLPARPGVQQRGQLQPQPHRSWGPKKRTVFSSCGADPSPAVLICGWGGGDRLRSSCCLLFGVWV